MHAGLEVTRFAAFHRVGPGGEVDDVEVAGPAGGGLPGAEAAPVPIDPEVVVDRAGVDEVEPIAAGGQARDLELPAGE